MAKPIARRVHSRFPCDLPVEIYSPVSQAKLADARLLDVSVGGGSVSSEFDLKRAQSYEFRVRSGKESLAVLGQVMWSSEGRFGVSFALTPAQETVLRSLVAKVKQP